MPDTSLPAIAAGGIFHAEGTSTMRIRTLTVYSLKLAGVALAGVLFVCGFSFPSLARDAAEGAQEPGKSPWIDLEAGVRSAYVGIQGGTAPINLLQSPDGSIHSLPGNTGNDFAQMLQSGSNATASRAALPQAPHTPPSPAPASATASGGYMPVGLSNPEGILFARSPSINGLYREEESIPYSPLKLGSYLRVLSRSGSL